MISYVMNKINQTNEMQNQEVEGEKVVNGVSVTKLSQTVGAIQSNPVIADFYFRAKGKWVNGGHNTTLSMTFMAPVKPTTELNPLYLKKTNHQYS